MIQIKSISEIVLNKENPRTISKAKYNKLMESIREFPQMLHLRPLVIDNDNVVIGGNMRLKACIELGYKEIPIIYADELTEEQKKEFIIKDNLSYGEWDFDILRADWNLDSLEDWGLDVPELDIVTDTFDDDTDLDESAQSYLNAAIRQIVLYYDNETHSKVLDDLKVIGEEYGIEEDNSAVVLKLIEVFNDNKK